MTTATETQPTISASPWQWAVWLRPRRTVYFLVRHVGDNHDDWSTGKVEYRQNKRGHVITYGTREQAIRIQNRLNAKGQRQ